MVHFSKTNNIFQEATMVHNMQRTSTTSSRMRGCRAADCDLKDGTTYCRYRTTRNCKGKLPTKAKSRRANACYNCYSKWHSNQVLCRGGCRQFVAIADDFCETCVLSPQLNYLKVRQQQEHNARHKLPIVDSYDGASMYSRSGVFSYDSPEDSSMNSLSSNDELICKNPGGDATTIDLATLVKMIVPINKEQAINPAAQCSTTTTTYLHPCQSQQDLMQYLQKHHVPVYDKNNVMTNEMIIVLKAEIDMDSFPFLSRQDIDTLFTLGTFRLGFRVPFQEAWARAF